MPSVSLYNALEVKLYTLNDAFSYPIMMPTLTMK